MPPGMSAPARDKGDTRSKNRYKIDLYDVTGEQARKERDQQTWESRDSMSFTRSDVGDPARDAKIGRHASHST